MPDDAEDHVALEFHGLVSDLQRAELEKFEEDRKKQAELRAALRRADPSIGLSAGELLKKLDGDPEAAARKVQDELDRVDREARAAVDKQKTGREPLPEGHFPPPPESG